jgi:hypothetical protein
MPAAAPVMTATLPIWLLAILRLHVILRAARGRPNKTSRHAKRDG